MNTIRTPTLTTETAKRWLFLFLLIHLCAWALVPAIIRNNLPLDSIEGTIWGHQLEWGYDKNPFMNGWLTALATYLDGQKGWMIYFFSQFSVLACFWSVWCLAKQILNPAQALLSVVLLECIQYYNFHAIDFNDNTLELGLWGLAIYLFYRAIKNTNSTRANRYINWIATGVFAALGMMAKYYTAALLGTMALFLLCEPSARRQLKTLPPYVGLSIFLLIITPHIIWLFYHDFITVTYVFKRVANQPSWINHLINPFKFAWQQFETFTPALLLCLLLLIKNSRSEKSSMDRFNRDFLLCIGLGPFLLTLLLSILFGIKLRAGWGMPLQSLWGIILVAWLQPMLTKKRMLIFMTSIYSMISILVIAYIISLVNSPDESSANFPGKEIARTITQQWHNNYHTKLTYVGGSRWVGGNIEFYSTDHPAVYIELDKRRAPWINLNDLKRKGGVFVWDLTENEKIPDNVKQQFSRLQTPIIYEFDWQRNVHHLPPTRIAVAILPPEDKA